MKYYQIQRSVKNMINTARRDLKKWDSKIHSITFLISLVEVAVVVVVVVVCAVLVVVEWHAVSFIHIG